MKDRWRNFSISLTIAVILTAIFSSFMYVSYVNKIKELNEFESNIPVGVSGSNDIIIKEYNQNVLFATIVGSIFLFCMATFISYMLIERLRKRKKKN